MTRTWQTRGEEPEALAKALRRVLLLFWAGENFRREIYSTGICSRSVGMSVNTVFTR
jgi:hypothetical protein